MGGRRFGGRCQTQPVCAPVAVQPCVSSYSYDSLRVPQGTWAAPAASGPDMFSTLGVGTPAVGPAELRATLSDFRHARSNGQSTYSFSIPAGAAGELEVGCSTGRSYGFMRNSLQPNNFTSAYDFGSYQYQCRREGDSFRITITTRSDATKLSLRYGNRAILIDTNANEEPAPQPVPVAPAPPRPVVPAPAAPKVAAPGPAAPEPAAPGPAAPGPTPIPVTPAPTPVRPKNSDSPVPLPTPTPPSPGPNPAPAPNPVAGPTVSGVDTNGLRKELPVAGRPWEQLLRNTDTLRSLDVANDTAKKANPGSGYDRFVARVDLQAAIDMPANAANRDVLRSLLRYMDDQNIAGFRYSPPRIPALTSTSQPTTLPIAGTPWEGMFREPAVLDALGHALEIKNGWPKAADTFVAEKDVAARLTTLERNSPFYRPLELLHQYMKANNIGGFDYTK